MKKLFSVFFSIVFIVAITIPLFMYLTASYGYVITVFWDWFVLPVFPLAPTFSIVQAYGLTMIFQIINFPKELFNNSSKNKTQQEKVIALANLFFRPWWFLFIGYLVSLFL